MTWQLVGEMVCGGVAIMFTAIAFTELSWSQGGSDDTMKRRSQARAGRLFVWATAFWILTVGFYFTMH